LVIGNGQERTLTDGVHNGYITIPDETGFHPSSYNADNAHEKLLIQTIFQDIISNEFQPKILGDRAILCTHNTVVDKINQLATEMFSSSESATYSSVDYVSDINTNAAANYPIEYLNFLHPSSLPPHLLHLKVGQLIILICSQKGACTAEQDYK